MILKPTLHHFSLSDGHEAGVRARRLLRAGAGAQPRAEARPRRRQPRRLQAAAAALPGALAAPPQDARRGEQTQNREKMNGLLFSLLRQNILI